MTFEWLEWNSSLENKDQAKRLLHEYLKLTFKNISEIKLLICLNTSIHTNTKLLRHAFQDKDSAYVSLNQSWADIAQVIAIVKKNENVEKGRGCTHSF